jgi:hypothetical protein
MTRGQVAAWMLGASAISIAAPAVAAPLVFSASDEGDGARVSARYADGRAAPPAANAKIDGSMLILSFDEPIEADLSKLAAGAPKTIAFARVDGDGRSVRIILRRTLVAKTAAAGPAQIIALAAPPKPKPAPKVDDATGLPVDVGVISGLTANPLTANDVMLTIGKRPEFTRLSFLFPHGATVMPLQSGDKLTLKFSRPGEVDISELRIVPPKFLKDAVKLSKPGQPLVVQLTLEPGVKQRHFVEGARAVVDLLPPDEPKKPVAQAAAAIHAPIPAPPKPAPEVDPTPKGGVVKVAEEEGAGATTFSLRWAGPARAAAFRRGEAIWLVFDANARLDTTGIPRVGKRHTDLQVVNGEHVVALRIGAPPEILVTAKADGNTWSFILSERAAPLASVAPVSREAANQNGGGARLVADFERDGAVRWIDDPEIGDRFAAALLSSPIKGVDVRRATMEAALLPAAQGAAIEPRADGVGAAFEEGKLVITRGEGMIATASPAAEPLGDLSAPVLLDLAAWGGSPKTRAVDVLDRLQRTAAVEGVEPGAKADARMQLARFLLANELSAEALGALRVAALNQPELESQADFKLMRAAANLMMGRVKDAQIDLSAGVLAGDPSAALWRGYAAAQEENWPVARRALEQGRSALLTQPRSWRVRFQLALGEAALELNDFAAAEGAISTALGEAASDDQRARAQLLQGRLAYARNDLEGALAAFDKLAQGHDEGTLVRATLEGVKLKRELNKITAAQAADTLEALRFRWRGDATELEIIQALGHTYEDMGRWREALSVMHAASARFPTLPAARRLRIDMGSMFERLFLDGEADKLQAIQALGLFYEFKDLTPIGASGDRMIRLLSARLVQVDLLEKASELLQYQVDNRLDGVGQAQVAIDLASIYLADKQPQKAMMAIENTRQPGVPSEIAGQRRVIEAKALVDLAQYDHAIELLEKDASLDAAVVRAEVAWRQKAWPQAAAALLVVLQRRSDPNAALKEEERTQVLRAAIAATLADSRPLLDRIKKQYGPAMAKGPDADAFELVTTNPDPSDYRIKDLARRVAQTDLVAKVLQDLKARLAQDLAPKA